MNSSGAQGESSSKPHASRWRGRRDNRAKTVSFRAISHLVVVLDEDHETGAVGCPYGAAVAATAKRTVTAIVHKYVVQ